MTAETHAPARPIDRDDSFTPERHVNEPHKVGLPPVLPYVRELWRRREFAIELSRTELRSQHFNTAFGQLWLILNPLLLAGVYFVLVDILRRGHRPPGAFAHLMAGVFAYYFFSQSLQHGVKSVVSGGKLILNTAFPRILLPISSVITAFMRFIPTFVIYVPVHLLSHRPVGLHLLWVFPMIVLLVLIASGFTMLVAAGQVYFRDLKSFLPYALRLWLYVTPILYFARDLPHGYGPLLTVNPLGRLLASWSNVIIQGQGPGLQNMIVATVWAVVLFVVGALFFMSREREFAVRL